MNIKTLLVNGDINDATQEYINIIKKASAKAFDGSHNTEGNITIAISVQAVLFNLLFLKPRTKLIFWFQGVVPEEITFLYPGIYSNIKGVIFKYIEKYILKKAKLIFFVSEKMHQHYKLKYGYDKDNYIIMPCYNQQLNESCFTTKKYESPSFVYAGNMAKWQCIDETLILFSKIKKEIPESTLAILTADQNEAHKLLAKYGVNAVIKYVQLKELPNEMAKYKYGFILRQKNIINEVSTPTKMSSYLAAGVIPIFSDTIGDFNKIFKSLRYTVSCHDCNESQIISKIIEIEKRKIDVNEILGEYKYIFDTYYNKNAYITDIAEKLRKMNRIEN